MFQVPAHLWQEIAKEADPPLTSRWGKAMAGGEEAINSLLAQIDRQQEADGIPDRVTLAFEITAPLLVENAAIQAFVQSRDDPELMQALPDLGSPETAAAIGATEYRLTAPDVQILESLLSKELDKSTA
jgi:hypothetical protein